MAESVMGRVLRVTRRNPAATTNPEELDFWEDANGIIVRDDPGVVWMKFLKPIPEITAVLWRSTVSYAYGDMVYFHNESTGVGNFYTVVALDGAGAESETTAGDSPLTAPTSFELVEIPRRFAAYLTSKIAADWARWQGKGELAMDQEAQAQAELDRQLTKWERDQRQNDRLQVRVRNN
jgi:hypothetical protein